MSKLWEEIRKKWIAKLPVCAKCGKIAKWEIQYLDKIVFSCQRHLGQLVTGYSIVKLIDKRNYE